jgi:hypothetical protein
MTIAMWHPSLVATVPTTSLGMGRSRCSWTDGDSPHPAAQTIASTGNKSLGPLVTPDPPSLNRQHIELMISGNCPWALRQHQERGLFIGLEGFESSGMTPKTGENLGGRAVSQAHPDDLGRRAMEKTPLVKVIVLGNDGMPLLAGQRPDGLVVCLFQAQIAHVGRAGKAGTSLWERF